MVDSPHAWVVIAEQSVPGEELRQQIEWCRECGALKSNGRVEFPKARVTTAMTQEIVDARPWGEVCPR
jgi:hypothetical protein